MAVAEILRLPRVARSGRGVRQWLVGTIGTFEHSHKSVQTDREMSDAYRLQHREHHCTFHRVARSVLSMRLEGPDVEVCEVSRAGFQRGSKP